jgi:hypothetical protein
MNFNLTKPCKHCPFRNDIDGFLTKGRAEEIFNGMTEFQGTFTCHKTTVETEEGEMVDGPNAEHCAGALILLEKLDQPNQMMRIAERIGMYDRRKLDMDSPVFDNEDEFVEAQSI